MKNFTFGNNNVALSICGIELSCDCVTIETKAMQANGVISELGKKLQAGTVADSDVEQAIEQVIGLYMPVFGTENMDKILAGKTVSVYDMLDMTMYILEVCGEFEKNKAAVYQSMKNEHFA